jgi:hypothetical protein
MKIQIVKPGSKKITPMHICPFIVDVPPEPIRK